MQRPAGCRVQGAKTSTVQGAGCRVQDAKTSTVQDAGFSVQGSGCKAQHGAGLRVQGAKIPAGCRVERRGESLWGFVVGFQVRVQNLKPET